MDARSAEAEPGEDGAGEGATPHLVLDGSSGPLELLLSLAREQRIWTVIRHAWAVCWEWKGFVSFSPKLEAGRTA